MNFKYFQILTISLGLHLGLYWFLGQISSLAPEANERLEFVLLDPSQNKTKRQIVMDDQPSPEQLKELQEKVALLSKTTRRVKEELSARLAEKSKSQTQAKRQESLRGIPKPQPPKNISETVKADNELILPRPVGQEQRPTSPGISQNLRLSESTNSDYIPNVKQGSFTALNTDQFTYYTFFARINNQIRPRWVQRLRNVSQRASRQKLSKLATKDRLTQLEAIFNSKGYHVRTMLLQSSGDEDLDLAAVKAIEDSAPFLNPPAGLIEEDGFIHLNYQFVLVYNPTYLAKENK